MYKVTKQFIGGILNGLTYTEITEIHARVGFRCNKPVGGSPYRIIRVDRVAAINR